jgi:UDP-N-acetylglucosamine:LPS N-acetylglucosamine transferase
MEKNGHQIIIAAPKDTPLFLKAKESGFKVYGIEFKRLSIIKDYKLLKHIFNDEKPDIINTHGNKDSKLALFAATRARVPLRILSRHISAHVKNSWYNRMVYKKLCHYIFTTADYTTRILMTRMTLPIKSYRHYSMNTSQKNGLKPPVTL